MGGIKMTEQELISLYEQELPIFQAWGEYIQKEIEDKLAENNNLDTFLKIPTKSRIKAIDSLVSKALHRKKSYSNPYYDIEDKVGLRFVVLLSEETKVICNIIEKSSCWNFSKDKDFEKNRDEYPESFPYESIHYVLKNCEELTLSNIKIPENTPCEVQIRTLLQHAYAELAHETLYKKEVRKKEKIQRFLARSMALVESADHFFLQAKKNIKLESKKYKILFDLCSNHYPPDLLMVSNNESNLSLLDTILSKNLITELDLEFLDQYLTRDAKLLQKIIMDRHHISFIYRLPAILLLFFLVDEKPATLRDCHILSFDILEQLYRDRGATYYIE